MDRIDFAKLLRRDLYPVLRSEGFCAGGTTLRRYADPVVHVFNVQGSQDGRICYVNLGVHLAFLPAEGEGPCDPASIKEYECAFRRRLGTSWRYGTTPDEAERTVADMLVHWHQEGRRYLASLSKYPDDFAAIVRDGAAGEPHPRECLCLARIALELGMNAEARALVRSGLGRVGPAAKILRCRLDTLARAAQEGAAPAASRQEGAE